MPLIERVRADNAVVIYQSPLLRAAGVPHAFSTRIGGVSDGPFASLNLGNPGGVAEQDSTDHIRENYFRLHQAIGCAARRRVFAHQVHGACVLDPATTPVTDSIHGGDEIGKADGIVSSDPNLLLSVRTADCVPVLIAHESGRHVAAVHAGWRGVVADVVPIAVREVIARASHCPPDQLRIAIGPSIGFDSFEVGAEVIAEFVRVLGVHAPVREGASGKGHVDLRLAIVRQLERLGVSLAQIDVTDRCTVTHAEEFFSHRREHGVTGRMASVIGARA